jgi:AhpD family alkylhydroperoxidase
MMAARVIYARMPRLLWPQLLMYRLAARRLSLPPLLVHQVQIRVSQQNGCSFCTDLHQAVALREGHERSRLLRSDGGLLESGPEPAEHAALRYVDEVCASGQPTDATFEALRARFDERQIVELTWLCAFTTYLNRLATPLGIESDGFCATAPGRVAQ